MNDNEELPPPPPAYSDTEFDQKVQDALLASEKVRQPEPEDQWEQWDEALFEAAASGKAANSYQHASSSSTSPTVPVASGSSSRGLPAPPPGLLLEVAPLRIQRAHPRPQLQSPDSQLSDSTNYATAPRQQQQQQSTNNSQSDDEQDDLSAAPPPPFSAVGPSLDGPPFEETQALNHGASEGTQSASQAQQQQRQWQRPSPAPVIPSPEPYQPPLTTVRDRHSLPPTSQQYHRPSEFGESRYSLPASTSSTSLPRFSSYTGRPASNYSTTMANNRAAANASRLNFDPSMAYGSSASKAGMSAHEQASSHAAFDPMSLYNSAIVPHMKPKTHSHMQPRRASNVANQPPRPPSAQSHYSQAVSDRTSIMSHPAPMSQPFAPIPQYPARPVGANAQFARYPQPHQNTAPSHAPMSYDRWASSESQYAHF